MTILETVQDAGAEANEFLHTNIGFIGAGVGGAALGGTVALLATSKARVSKKRKAAKPKHRRTRKTHSRKKRSHKPTKRSRHKVTKRTSHRRIHKTKNGQPYIILASGKARFIKKSSASSSRKRKGGRY